MRNVKIMCFKVKISRSECSCNNLVKEIVEFLHNCNISHKVLFSFLVSYKNIDDKHNTKLSSISVRSGALRNGGDNEVSYGTRLNGDSERVPLTPGDRNMFVLPRALNDGDSITVSGTFNNPERFTINLLTGYSSPDYNNIVCQLEANFTTSSNSSNGIILRIIDNGQTEVQNGTYMNHSVSSLMTGSTFEISFKFEAGNRGDTVTIYVQNSILEQFILKHQFDQISFLKLEGDANVTGLAFQFAQ